MAMFHLLCLSVHSAGSWAPKRRRNVDELGLETLHFGFGNLQHDFRTERPLCKKNHLIFGIRSLPSRFSCRRLTYHRYMPPHPTALLPATALRLVLSLSATASWPKKTFNIEAVSIWTEKDKKPTPPALAVQKWMQDGCLAKTATNYEKHSSSGRNASVPTIRKTARMTSQVPHQPQGEDRHLTTHDTQPRHSPEKEFLARNNISR